MKLFKTRPHSYLSKILLMFLIGLSTTHCSNVSFETIPPPPIPTNPRCAGNDNCTQVNPPDPTEPVEFMFQYNFKLGKTDILFVDDNSGSMSTEQEKMAQKFNNFVNTFDSKNIDYRIAVVTTDVSKNQDNPSADDKEANGHGAFQDGKFLEFPNHQYVLTPTSGSTPQKQNWFRTVIKRKETLDCEAANYAEASCPSTDERGIYAANLAVQNTTHSEFFRKDAHLAVVFLSDEDERSNGGALYPLEAYDLPTSLVSNINSKFGVEKTMSFHSLIVRPGDASCKAYQDSQGNQWVSSSYGYQYAKLSKAQPDEDLLSLGSVQGGSTGDICAGNYTSQLVSIASIVSAHAKKRQLDCAPHFIEVTLDPLPATPVEYTVDSNNLLQFTSDVPAGTNVGITIKCHSL